MAQSPRSILKNHFALSAADYRERLNTGVYAAEWGSLSIEQIPATVQNYIPLVSKLGAKWQWDRQERYTGASLKEKLSRGELFLLKDNGRAVGYAFASAPSDQTKDRFFAGKKVIEIENLGMFPGEEGGGRGKKYFEMLFQRYFNDYDVVYWSQHETHAPTLKRFYIEKMGMEFLGADNVPDFRTPPSLSGEARRKAIAHAL